MNKLWNIHIMECYSLIKKEQATTTCNNMDESLRRRDEQRWQTHKKTRAKQFHVYEFKNRQN